MWTELVDSLPVAKTDVQKLPTTLELWENGGQWHSRQRNTLAWVMSTWRAINSITDDTFWKPATSLKPVNRLTGYCFNKPNTALMLLVKWQKGFSFTVGFLTVFVCMEFLCAYWMFLLNVHFLCSCFTWVSWSLCQRQQWKPWQTFLCGVLSLSQALLPQSTPPWSELSLLFSSFCSVWLIM